MAYDPEHFMRRCLELAENGLGSVAPNPLVGAVVVHRNKVIGEGFHQKYGSAHAEVNAIRNVKDEGLLEESTLYVNLEPCAHTGKTPPCTDLILTKRIPGVVIGSIDPNSLVAGKGIDRLKNAGVEVLQGVLEKDCRELNRRFFTFYEKKRPYIILKWAQTTDGFMDIERKTRDPIGVNWISNAISQTLVHKWRAEEQAIITSSQTVLLDDPQLTVRHWEGDNPLRIVLDSQLKVPQHARILDHSAITWVINAKEQKNRGNIEYLKIEKTPRLLPDLMDVLYRREIQSLIVEGGRALLMSMLKAGLWDEARVIVGEKKFVRGLKAPEIEIPYNMRERILRDWIYIYRNPSTLHFV